MQQDPGRPTQTMHPRIDRGEEDRRTPLPRVVAGERLLVVRKAESQLAQVLQADPGYTVTDDTGRRVLLPLLSYAQELLCNLPCLPQLGSIGMKLEQSPQRGNQLGGVSHFLAKFPRAGIGGAGFGRGPARGGDSG
jgi:hypothetical protein